jgi:cell division protein FtsL
MLMFSVIILTGFPHVGSVLLIAMTVASIMALVGIIYINHKSRQIAPIGYDQLRTRSDRL